MKRSGDGHPSVSSRVVASMSDAAIAAIVREVLDPVNPADRTDANFTSLTVNGNGSIGGNWFSLSQEIDGSVAAVTAWGAYPWPNVPGSQLLIETVRTVVTVTTGVHVANIIGNAGTNAPRTNVLNAATVFGVAATLNGEFLTGTKNFANTTVFGNLIAMGEALGVGPDIQITTPCTAGQAFKFRLGIFGSLVPRT